MACFIWSVIAATLHLNKISIDINRF